MKVSALFTVLVATLAVASPLVEPEVDVHELGARNPDVINESNAYKSAKKAMPDLQVGVWYKFYSKSPFTPLGDDETPREIAALQERLGYDHIAVVVGEVVSRTKRAGHGRHRHKVITHDFEAKKFELIKIGDTKAQLLESVFKPTKVFDLDEGARTTKGRAERAGMKARAYFQKSGKAKYNTDSNNCDTFARALFREI